MPKIEYEGRVKEVKIIEKKTGDTDSKDAEVTIVTDDEKKIIIKNLDCDEAEEYTPTDSVKVVINTTQTKLE